MTTERDQFPPQTEYESHFMIYPPWACGVSPWGETRIAVDKLLRSRIVVEYNNSGLIDSNKSEWPLVADLLQVGRLCSIRPVPGTLWPRPPGGLLRVSYISPIGKNLAIEGEFLTTPEHCECAERRFWLCVTKSPVAVGDVVELLNCALGTALQIDIMNSVPEGVSNSVNSWCDLRSYYKLWFGPRDTTLDERMEFALMCFGGFILRKSLKSFNAMHLVSNRIDQHNFRKHFAIAAKRP